MKTFFSHKKVTLYIRTYSFFKQKWELTLNLLSMHIFMCNILTSYNH